METIEHVLPGDEPPSTALAGKPSPDAAASGRSQHVAAPYGPLGMESAVIAGVRAADPEAMAVLYRRYREPGLVFTRGLMSGAQEAEDVFHEAFVKAVGAIQNGRGPTDIFGPYLRTSIKSVVATFWKKGVRELPAPEQHLRTEPEEDPGLENVLFHIEHRRITAAMATLPVRWRTVLWHAEVMGDKPKDLAPLLGIEPNAVSALLMRAKAGLRAAYLKQAD